MIKYFRYVFFICLLVWFPFSVNAEEREEIIDEIPTVEQAENGKLNLEITDIEKNNVEEKQQSTIEKITKMNKINFKERVADMAVVRSVRVGASSDRVRIVIDASKPMKYKTIVLSNPSRIVVDIKNAWMSPDVARETIIGSRFAKKVRVGQFTENTVRIVVETTVKKGNYDVFPLNLEAGNPRLVLDFGRVGNGTRDDGYLQNISGIRGKGGQMGRISGTTRREEEKEELTPEIKMIPGLHGKKIAIDPGHGGEDSGAIGFSGTQEKEVTLRLSVKLKKLLEDAGAKVIMTRMSDSEVSPKRREANDVEELQSRCDIANKAGADIFLSIHMDSFTSNVANGTTSFYYAKGTATSKRLAQAVQKALVTKLNTENRGIKACNFYVVKHTKMPATLVEVGFLSNPKEEKLIISDKGIQKAAEGIFDGILVFFGK